jgi:ribosomal protein L7/L12
MRAFDLTLAGKYRTMRNTGTSSADVMKAIRADGASFSESIKLIREIFGLSFVEAKEAYVISDGHNSLDEYQEQIASVLEEAQTELAQYPDDESEG